MGTFRARFTILSMTGDAFLTFGVGDNAFHYYENANKSGVINFSLIGSCFYLDGSGIPISFAGLPAGFTPTWPLTLSSPQTITGGGVSDGALGLLQVPADATGSLLSNYGTYGPVSINITGFLGPFTDIILAGVNSLLAILTFQCSITHNVLLGNAVEVYDVIDISGDYTILQYSYDIPQDGDEVDPGETITITSPGTDPLTDLDLSQLTITMACGTVIPIIQTPTMFRFTVPFACSGAGVSNIVATGNGVQFSGSVTLGTLDILLANASGIYTLVRGKTNDTLYSGARDGTTYDVKIPDPFAKTGYIGG